MKWVSDQDYLYFAAKTLQHKTVSLVGDLHAIWGNQGFSRTERLKESLRRVLPEKKYDIVDLSRL